jgi:hypothetical protein
MFEVIISTVNTGRIQRKTFANHDQADAYVERFLNGGPRPRSLRDYRVEVRRQEEQPRPAPPAATPAMTPAA